MAGTHPTLPSRYIKDIQGRRFGRLLVKRFSHVGPRRKAFWICLCDCGSQKVVSVANLCAGNTKSCGCRWRWRHGKRGSKVYKAWADMLQRCENPKDSAYKNYGGRGITVCKEWHNFAVFYRDMGDPPTGYTLERTNNNNGYCLQNCRWATRSEQCRNSRQNRLLTFQGKTQCLATWAEELEISRGTVYSRLRRGWKFHRALTTPARKGNYRRRKISL